MLFPVTKKVNENIKGNDSPLLAIKPVQEYLGNIPTTRYSGSKRKLLHWIFENIKSIDFHTVLDGFGGTGSVSLLFKAMGKNVTYHDAFLFNKDVAHAILQDTITLDEEYFQKFVNETIPTKGFIYNNFKGLYYTDDENCWLDGFLEKLLSSKLTKREESVFRYSLYQACLKKRPFNLFHRGNLNIRLRQGIKRSFGNKTTWETPFPKLIEKSYKELVNGVIRNKSQTSISKSSCISKIKSGFDLVYLDPPYINQSDRSNRDGYWRRYHFLEGLSKYKEWGGCINPESSIREMYQPKTFVDWGSKNTFKENLFALIKKHRKSIVVLSYVSNIYPDEKEITEFFESIFLIVSVHSKEHSHVLCKKRKREILFIGRNQ